MNIPEEIKAEHIRYSKDNKLKILWLKYFKAKGPTGTAISIRTEKVKAEIDQYMSEHYPNVKELLRKEYYDKISKYSASGTAE